MASKPPRSSRLDTFLQAQRIVPSEWDLLLFGDGSGGGWAIGGAFVVFMVDKRLPTREVLVGGWSKTTVNRMELGAYTEALSFHYHNLLKGVITDPPYNVWAFTDSELTAKCGSGQYVRKANADLWNTVDWYETRGYRIHWRHLKRNTTDFHASADAAAGKIRRALLEHVPDDVYGLMPYVEPEPEDAAVGVCEQCKTPMQKELTHCPICGHERNSHG